MATRRASSASIAGRDDTVSLGSPSAQGDVFDDEFAEDYADSIHSEPSGHEDPFLDPVSTTASSPIHGGDLQSDLAPSETPLQSRNSIRKAPLGSGTTRDGSGGAEDESNWPMSQVTAQPISQPNRTLSTNSSAFATPQSPTQLGQSGPSHPYTMYPQGLETGRSASTATASTSRDDAPSSSSRGPAHPYALYPQTVSSDSSSTDEAPVIPVGFPGHSQRFHRQIGPEGEEQDIVGPYGQLEQLPPYTRYPENASGKVGVAAVMAPRTEIRNDSSPEEPLMEMQERPRSVAPVVAETPEPAPPSITQSTPVSSQDEKRWAGKSWKEKRNHKLCGFLPVWVLLLIIVSCIVIAAVCGGVIGWFMSRPPKSTGSDTRPFTGDAQSPPLEVTITTTQYVDATPITTPTSISMLATGTFAVSLATAFAQGHSCLNSTQQQAWSCTLPTGQTSFDVGVNLTGNDFYISLIVPDAVIDYGAQPPAVQQQELTLVLDQNNESLGAAYHFQTFYDKLVVLPAAALSSVQKREAQPDWSASPPPPTSCTQSFCGAGPTPSYIGLPWWITQHRVKSGDTPWFCYWNNTYLEGFVYVDDPVSPSSASVIAITSSTPSTLTSTTNAYTTSSSASTQASSTLLTSTTTNKPGSTSSYSLPTQTGYQAKRSATSASAVTTTFPQLIHLQDRRLSGYGQATCTKMSKGSDGAYTSVVVNGSPIEIALDETDPIASYVDARKKRELRKRDLDGCYCQWTS